MNYKFAAIVILFISFKVNALNGVQKIEQSDTTRVVDKTEIYTITEEGENVLFTMSSSDPKTMMAMLHQGIVVYFDVKGKKKRNVGVTYPVIDRESRPKRDKSEDTEIRSTQQEEDFNNKIIEMLNNEVPQGASYTYYEETRNFNILMNNLTIGATFDFESERGVLTYRLSVPKSKINTDPSVSLSKMTVGVKSPERPSNEERPSASLGGGGQGGGGRGQGGPPSGGGRGGSGGGGQGGRGGQRGGNQNQSQTSLNFWFDAGL